MNLRNLKTVKERKGELEKELSVDLSNIGSFSLDEHIASSRNCENMIGVAQVPMGIAGPLAIKNLKLKIENYYIPLATTEGALVASVSRGCKAITQSGGAAVLSHKEGATRGPVFKVHSMQENDLLYTFLEDHFSDFQKLAAGTSNHLTLTHYSTRSVGKYRYVRFIYDTEGAMGMNMVTIATDHICAFIEKETGISCLALAGNFDIDKKPAWLNFLENRGIEAWAEVTIPSDILHTVLKTSVQKIYDVWLAKCMIGSAMSGSMGYNAQYANIIAATFLATGQDLGHVGEGSMGITTTEVVGKDLYISVYLPDLMVGVVGGGTTLATQKEALSIIGAKNSQQFAEVIAAAVLAGEISLLASLSEGTLARAHERLARGK
jgi:hydroxymethylglutaryl-CoA reductase (NADPH)